MSATYPFGNDPVKIAGYRAFWDRAPVKRPLVGFSIKSWFPLQEFSASAAWQDREVLTPDMIEPAAFLDDQERQLQEGEIIEDDILRGASPSQAVPWLDGMLGAALRILPATVLGVERTLEVGQSWQGYVWTGKILGSRSTLPSSTALVRRSAGRYPISHGTLIGPSDIAALLRGHTQSVLRSGRDPRSNATAASALRRYLPRDHCGSLETHSLVSRRILRRPIPALVAWPDRPPSGRCRRRSLSSAVSGVPATRGS